MEVKIAHCSDLHLGCSRDYYSRQIDLKNSERKKAFIDMLIECSHQKVDFLLIAGDLFDDVNVDNMELQEIKDILEKYCIKTVIAPGNHDPFTIDSPYYSNDWPKNVFIFKTNKLTYFEIPSLKTRIWGAAFNNIYESKGMLKVASNIDDDFLNICVMHGNIVQSSDCYNPISKSDIEESKMNYIAFGHIHKRSEIYKLNSTFYSYSGSLYGNNFGETGEKGFYLGKISKNKCELEFKKVNCRRYEKANVDVSLCSNMHEIVKCILNKLESMYGEDFQKNFYEITLKGTLEETFVIDRDYINVLIDEKLFFAKILDDTNIEVDIEKLGCRNDFKSIFIKKALVKIENSQSEEERKINENALKIGIRAFAEGVKYYDN